MLVVVALAVFWLIWGILNRQYGLDSIAALLFVAALICGLLGAVFRLDGMRFSDIARAFQTGAGEFIGPVLVVGMVQGILIMLGGASPTGANVLNTLLHWVQRVLSGLSSLPAALLMYISQLGLHFALPFDLEQAALSMPVMAQLADTLGISRQISVLTFQLGAGLAPLITPTSGCLLAVLTVARLEWATWLRTLWRPLLILLALAAVVTLLATGIGYA